MKVIGFDIFAKDRASGSFDKVASKVEELDGRLGKSSGIAKVYGAVAGAAVVGFAKSAIDKASDLNETLSKSNVVFGKSAGSVQQWAGSSATSLGLSKQAALDSATGFGDMFKQLGVTQPAAVGMSKSVVQMAADLGSFNNLPTSEVLDSLSGAFRGEYDSLQRVIPNISAARVEQEALAETHKKSASKLTAAEKATAVLAIVQKDGSRAAGDFARTSGGLANQQKIAKAEFENLQATIGSKLLPVMTSLLGTGLAVSKWMGENSGKVKLAVAAVGALVAVVLISNTVLKAQLIATNAAKAATLIWSGVTKVAAAAQWLFNAAMSANPLALVVIGLIALGAAAVLAYQRSATFRAIVQAAFAGVKVAAGAMWGFIKVAFTGLRVAFDVLLAAWRVDYAVVRAVLSAFGVAVGVAKTVISAGLSGVRAAFSAAAGYVRSQVAVMLAVARALWSGISSAASGIAGAVGWIGGAFATAYSTVSRYVGNIVSAVSGLPGRVARLAGDMFGAGASMMRGLGDGIASVAGSVINFGGDLAHKLSNALGLPHSFGPWSVGAGPIHITIPGFSIPGFAKGGVPTGLSLVGEGGPELFVPPAGGGRILSRSDSMAAVSAAASGVTAGGGDVTYHITVVGVSDPKAAAREVIDRIDTLRSRHGRGSLLTA